METENIDYAAWIGLDWGSPKHAICLKPAGSGTVERYTVEQKPEALYSWFMNLIARFDGRNLALAIEQTRGAVIHFLLGLASVHIFTIHPKIAPTASARLTMANEAKLIEKAPILIDGIVSRANLTDPMEMPWLALSEVCRML